MPGKRAMAMIGPRDLVRRDRAALIVEGAEAW
ncbi:hypothetical protein FBY35_3285 [Streptomyces sp. SLBN-118]|nr:hypothetical protein FBY35_3285 [Streptomyces sp. SLBN-118]